jgi:nucleoside 2-deoxyribosyltransferase
MSEEKKCPICKEECNIRQEIDGSQKYNISCLICGDFKCSEQFYVEQSKSNLDFTIRGVLRERFINGLNTYLTNKSAIEDLLKTVSVPQNIRQKIDKFLINSNALYLKESPGQEIKCNKNLDYSLAYCKDSQDFSFIIDAMSNQGYFSKRDEKSSFIILQLNLKAWDRIEELKQINKESKQGFIACWFSNPDKPQATIFESINETGYNPMMIDDMSYPETILEKGLGEIKKSKFVVADLSGWRKSVIFEAGFAKGLGIDVIYVISKKEWDIKDEKGDNNKEFYCSSYQIGKYKDHDHLKEIVSSAIKARY